MGPDVMIFTNNLLIHGFTLSRNWCRKRIQESHPYLSLCPSECYLYSTGELSLPFKGVMGMLRHLSCLTLCNPMDCSPPGSSVHGILPAGILELVAMPSSKGSSLPQDWTHISCIVGGFFAHWATWEAPKGATDPCKNVNYVKPLHFLTLQEFLNILSNILKMNAAAVKSLWSCPTLCNPTDGSLPGSAVPRILQARTLEWVAIAFSNASNWKVKVKLLSRVWLFVTPWTATYQAPPSVGLTWRQIISKSKITNINNFIPQTCVWR